MIKFIYDNRILPLITLILGVVLLRLAIFSFGDPLTVGLIQRGLFRTLLSALNNYPWWSFWIATLIIILNSLILGQLVWEYNVIEKPGYSIVFFYGILTALFGGTLLMNYVVFGSFFLLLGFWYLYRYLKGQYRRTDLFISALFMGFAALSVPEFFWSMVFLVVLVLVFKATEAAEVFVIVFGILMPYYLISSIGYLSASELDFKSTLALWNFRDLRILENSKGFANLDWILVANVLLVAVFGVIKVFSSYYRFNVDSRRSRLAMGLIGIFVLLVYLFKFNFYRDFFVALSIPLSVYTAYLFQMERPSILARLLFYTYFIVVASYEFW